MQILFVDSNVADLHLKLHKQKENLKILHGEINLLYEIHLLSVSNNDYASGGKKPVDSSLIYV